MFRFVRGVGTPEETDVGLVLVSAEPRRLAGLLPALPLDPSNPPPESGLGGRLAMRFAAFGGCGNAAMLMVRRIVLLGGLASFELMGVLLMAETVRMVGRLEVEFAGELNEVGEAKPDAEGALRPDRGSGGADSVEGADGSAPRLLRVRDDGRGGRAVLGGPRDGLDGRGAVAAIL